MQELMSLGISGVLLVVLVAPPVLALVMLFRRLRAVAPEPRTPYQALVALAGLVLAFNLTVWLGMPAGLRGALPDFVDRNLGVSALLGAWGALGLCGLLAVLSPYRHRPGHRSGV